MDQRGILDKYSRIPSKIVGSATSVINDKGKGYDNRETGRRGLEGVEE